MASDRAPGRWERLAALAVWIVLWQAAAMTLGHGGLFLATPVQTLAALARIAPTAGFWQRIAFSALRILAGFLLAVAGGLVLGAAGARWRRVRIFVEPVMQLIRAMPVASFVILALLWVRGENLSVVVSFTHVLPVVYAGVLAGIADTDPQLLEMARVYRLPLGARLRYIWLPGVFPSFSESCIAAMGMCWKSGVSAEVIGLPDHSVGDALYRAKITLSTPEVFAWTLVIVLLSALLSSAAARLLRAAKTRLCGEVRA
ncbi:MAG TPA: ABC transporter permease subunit [Candidatus Gemmiger avistercoris]|uniref:ABC transporter permease subunit n=1 Tax=Candidatus Gemmiger avistercoris TaxID=2838606 RepID=A0A9D2JQD1_9FIRM|nr:ABC transporter permease subunit [uncultured Subdoligranulum sp.]HIZ62109.1 ABC transporter permease subunit [Candidatus Gemmiger avistercoris]